MIAKTSKTLLSLFCSHENFPIKTLSKSSLHIKKKMMLHLLLKPESILSPT